MLTIDPWKTKNGGQLTTACTPIVLTYQANNQFNMSCGGHSLTKSWTDADVVAARAAAVQ